MISRLFLEIKGVSFNLSVYQQVPRNRSRVDSNDVYILDLGLTLIQWNGQGSNKDERFKVTVNLFFQIVTMLCFSLCSHNRFSVDIVLVCVFVCLSLCLFVCLFAFAVF